MRDNKMMKNSWWRHSVAYIIYPSTFSDANGDGFGDLKGIISHLDYLRELGINLLWIGPIFDSPMDDNGYDVKDFMSINPIYGDIDDLNTLLKEAHDRGIRILLDLSMNHTSDEHPWFKKAISDPSSKERDYYIIRKGHYENGLLVAPNNWKSFFSESVWTRIGESDEFYFHLFTSKMPDTNWANPALREEFYRIARYYIDLGVDGFRLDAAAHFAKDQSFASSSLSSDQNGLVYDVNRFSNRPELLDYLKEFREKACGEKDILLIGEVGGCVSPNQALTYSNYQEGPLTMVFNFDTCWNNGNYASIGKKDEDIVTDVLSLKHNFKRWYDANHEKADLPLYWLNHDHPRLVSQYGNINYRQESSKMLCLTLLFLYGTPFIYNGDEIGMSNFIAKDLSFYTRDTATSNSISEWRGRGFSDEEILMTLNRISRLHARTAYQWNKEKNAGFSQNDHPLVPINSNYLEGVNLLEEMEDPYSIVNFWQYAILYRRNPLVEETVMEGEFEYIDESNPDVFAYLHRGPITIAVVSNMRPYDVDLAFYYDIKNIELHNYEGVLIKDHSIHLRPFETYLLELR